MEKILDQYFKDELENWLKTLDFYESEIPEFETKLIELTRRNTIPNLAANAEHLLSLFETVREHINSIRKKIHGQEDSIEHHDLHQLDKSRTLRTVTQQNALRHVMQAAEKNFVDTKYSFYNFLAGIASAL
ncbi:MAG: hypothetical protein JNM57_16705 [Cyclobacteriaceae bacterium]|nr:hypothetical protein [Cyclobacteriaceae bacterium]